MGFLKRFFSIGIKRKKSKRVLADSDNAALTRIQEEEHEAAASRLLRSSSARFTVVSEVDYANLPPMPHPINNVVSSGSSTAAPPRSSFTVTIHRRTRHALTEFPNANPPLPIRTESEVETPHPRREYTTPLSRPHDSLRYRSKSTPFPMTPRDSNRLQRLRQDPSVASLVKLYDEHGCLPPNAFSNTPPEPPRERAQVRRNGSTLRQLLGNPEPKADGEDNSGLEGAISWAERFLGETDANSSTSSFGQCLRTPTELDVPFIHDHKYDNTTFSTDHDLSNVDNSNTSANYPTFSSLEVEVSLVADSPPLPASHHPTSPYQHQEPRIPQRASQVFGFLTERRQSRGAHEGLENSVAISTPHSHPAFKPSLQSRFSDYSAEYNALQDLDQSLSNALEHDTQDNAPSPTTSVSSLHRASFVRPSSLASDDNDTDENSLFSTILRHQSIILHSDITIQKLSNLHDTHRSSAAPIANTGHDTIDRLSTEHAQPDRKRRVLNGPRPRLSPHVSLMQHEEDAEKTNEDFKLVTRNALVDKSRQANNYAALLPGTKDAFTPVPSRRLRLHRRTASTSTLSLAQDSDVIDQCLATPVPPAPARRDWPRLVGDAEKENSVDTSHVLPLTPVGTCLRTPVMVPPSPASSTELSPVGRQMMTNLREQRIRGREAEKQRRMKMSTGVGDRHGW